MQSRDRSFDGDGSLTKSDPICIDGFMDERLANHVLGLVRGMGYDVVVTSIARADLAPLWRMEARSNSGETWIAEDPDYYRAAVLLAESVGADLEE